MNTNIKIHPMKWLEGVKVNHPVRTARVADGGANYNQSALDIACTARGDLKKEGTLTKVITLLLLTGVNHNESALRTTCLEGTGLVNHNESALRTACVEGFGENHNESMLKGKVNGFDSMNHNESVFKVHAGITRNHNESALRTACVEGGSGNHNESVLKGTAHATSIITETR